MSLASVLATQLASKCRLFSYQQVRHLRTFRLQHAYGEQPLTQPEHYEEAEKSGALDQLAYKKIRFALLSETSSPLWDSDLDNFTRYVMKRGRKDLAQRLMHETFYEMKSIQYKRLRRKLEKENKSISADSMSQKNETEDGHDETDNSGTVKSTAGTSDDAQNINATEEENDDGHDHIDMNPLSMLKKAVKNSEPILVTRKVKRGGATYQVPFPVPAKQSEYMAIKWLLQAVLERPKPRTKHFPEVMANELLDAAQKRGKVVKRRDDMHKLAAANKAYAHYRWG